MSLSIIQEQCVFRAASLTLFSYENLGSMAWEFSQKCETLRCENSTLAIICPLLLINGIDVTILWAGLAKRSKEISCSRNLVAACDFYSARRTFYASSYENLIEKKYETPQMYIFRIRLRYHIFHACLCCLLKFFVKL